MITVKQAIRLSAIIDKLDLKVNNPKGTAEEVGSDLLMQVVTNAHKAAHEIYAFVADHRGITKQEAENVDLLELANELLGDANLKAFFKSAVKSKAQE